MMKFDVKYCYYCLLKPCQDFHLERHCKIALSVRGCQTVKTHNIKLSTDCTVNLILKYL